MGRRPNVPQETRDGTYRCWHPGLKKYIGLGTRDFDTAVRIQAGFYPRRESVQSVPSQPAYPMVPGNGVEGDSVLDFDKLTGDGAKPDGASLLNKWATGGSVAQPPTPPPAVVSSDEAAPTGLASLFSSPNPTGPQPKGKKNQLTPEQSLKLASGLKKIVTNINIVACGAAVKMFGKIPAELDEDEIALVQMGWEMYIDEIFKSNKIKPWHVLLAANVMMGATMYIGGTDIPKRQLTSDPSKAKASVTPIDGGKS